MSTIKPLPPSRTAPQFVVRLPDAALRDRIAEEAKKNGRSMNAQIVFMLQAFLKDIDREEWEASPEAQEANQAAYEKSLTDPPKLPFRFGSDLIAAEIAEQRQQIEAMQLQNRASALEARLTSLESMRLSMQTQMSVMELSDHNDDGKKALRKGLHDVAERIQQTTTELKAALDAFSVIVSSASAPKETDAPPTKHEVQRSKIVLVGNLSREPRGILPEHISQSLKRSQSAPSRTPTIPGANAPKRGLGSPKTAAPKAAKPKVAVKKKRVME